MYLFRALLFTLASLLAVASPKSAHAETTNDVASQAVYVPDYSHANDLLPEGVIAWDALQKNTDATNGQDAAHFAFSFTNISSGPITILGGHGSCSCTTIEMQPTPWRVPAGGNGRFGVSINLAGKFGFVPKFAIIVTDRGSKSLMLGVNILPPPPMPTLTDQQRAMGVNAAKLDRQAVFKGDCVSCHAKNVTGKYAADLFAATCAICHEANPRASMVPDLHNLKDPTNEEFWRAWITAGKPGTLMPAFASSQGGPLTDLQIASLAAYLNNIIPPHAPTAAAK